MRVYLPHFLAQIWYSLSLIISLQNIKYYLVTIIFISLLTNNIEYIFMYLLTIYVISDAFSHQALSYLKN